MRLGALSHNSWVSGVPRFGVRLELVAVCQTSCLLPSETIAYQVAVDVTASNSDRASWPAQANKFVQRLEYCDSVRFHIIDDRTAQNAEYGDPVLIPLVDPNAGYPDGGKQLEDYEAALTQVRNRLNQLIARSSAAKVTDILSLFNRLDHAAMPPKRNILVVFSDGLESAAVGRKEEAGSPIQTTGRNIIDLEKNCVTDASLGSMLTTAQSILKGSQSLRTFSNVIWVVPSGIGKAGCNSLSELRLFWGRIVIAESVAGKAPTLEFETNPL